MKITIAERLHPFSHLPGVFCLLPKSEWQVEVFPALLRFSSLADASKQMDVKLSIPGPMQGFTAEVDLERGVVLVFGMTAQGYLRYQIHRQPDGISIAFEKLPKGGIVCACVQKSIHYEIKEKQTLLLPIPEEHLLPRVPEERLSLGMHKAQDWDLICRRQDLKEIFPLWLRLGQMTPHISQEIPSIGTFRLLAACQEAVANKETLRICPLFEQLFQTAFAGICVPHLTDEKHQGILPDDNIPSTLSALPILTLGGKLIRSLFFQEMEGGWKILPFLPSEFAAGRFVDIVTEKGEKISFEWAKHRLNKVVLHAAAERSVVLELPKQTRSLRLRTARTQKGKVVTVNDGYVGLALKANQILFLDRFER
jgi:hypothetical protein